MNEILNYFEKTFDLYLKMLEISSDFVLKSPFFLLSVGKLFTGFNIVKSKQNEFIEKLLSQLHIASKDDIDKILVNIHNLEGKINEVMLIIEEKNK